MIKLLEPMNIKGLIIKNRIIFPSMAMEMADEEGLVTEKVKAHYSNLAKLQLGAIIMEHHYISISGKNDIGQLAIDKDDCVEGLGEISKIIHENGTACGIQINHSGSLTNSSITGEKVIGPSPILHPRGTEIPREMTTVEINNIKKFFRKAAMRVKRAGFDFVEINGCHGHLLNQFISPLTNARLDEYGGIRSNRIKLPIEIIKGVREEVGDDFLIFYRIAADDNMENGITIDDAKYLAVKLADAGVDVLNVSQGLAGAKPTISQQGYFVHLAEGIKSVVGIPIITVGGITEALFAYQVIKDGKADIVGIGRAILEDPKWLTNAIQEINNLSE